MRNLTSLIPLAIMARALSEIAVCPSKYKNFPLILGSGSLSRKEILNAAGFQFTVRKADIDEKSIGDRSIGSVENAGNIVRHIAEAKAEAIFKKMDLDDNSESSSNSDILLTADQVVVCNGRILEKPKDETDARLYISYYDSFPCSTVGSIVLTDLRSSRTYTGVDSATIWFHPFESSLVDKLIAEGMVMDCAGGLMIEHPLVQPQIRKVDGTIDSVMGLSLNLLYSLLDKLLSDRSSDSSKRQN